MAVELPQVTHVYQHHTLDSTRWQHFTPRNDDIVIATPYKSGTTWMQMIVMHLIFQDLQHRPLSDYTAWLDACWAPVEEVIAKFEAQEHRRFIKTHLPLDGLRFFPQVKYIVVGRDPRDVCMSMWNHYSKFTDVAFDADCQDMALPRPPADIRQFWRDWITRGWFPWENEGYPFWSNMRHVQTWWDFAHLPNILFVHFNDLKRDLPAELRRIADYLAINIADDLLAQIAATVTFTTVKQHAEKYLPGAEDIWENGAQTFINKGTNGRWRDVLTADDLALYADAVARNLTPDCAAWLEYRNKD